MKSVFLIVGALIVIVIGIIIASAPNGTDAPAQTPVVETETNETPTAQEEMTAEEQAAMTGEAAVGSDVGMEMPIPDDTEGGEMRMFDISGENFAFDVKEIRVKEGDTVMIHFKSADGFHDLVIDEFNAKTERVSTGNMAMVTFVANKKGTFEYYCSVGSHRMNGMVGKLIVE